LRVRAIDASARPQDRNDAQDGHSLVQVAAGGLYCHAAYNP